MDQSHQPLWTAAPHPALARQQTHLQKQVNDQIKSSACPTVGAALENFETKLFH
jgi:hypothetical protein